MNIIVQFIYKYVCKNICKNNAHQFAMQYEKYFDKYSNKIRKYSVLYYLKYDILILFWNYFEKCLNKSK